MLYRKNNVSTRTLLQLIAAILLSVSGVRAASAAGGGFAPTLVPWTISTIAGNTQPASAGASAPATGYGGDGLLATGQYINGVFTQPTMNSLKVVAVDSVGNVYVGVGSNDIIQEINAQTGIMQTIAGVVPKGCTGIACTKTTSGCADGVPALNSPIGAAIAGMAVDAYGNLYFDDSGQSDVSVIYRGGTQVANFITLVNPAGVAKSNGVQLGYVYHIAGSVNLQTCVGVKTNTDGLAAFEDTSVTTVGVADALGNGSSGPAQIQLDSAGNIYVMDAGNNVVRVINTQATTQTFFGYSVAPGVMRAIVNCNATLTTACPLVSSPTANTGIGGPANAVTYGSILTAIAVDGYGNIYEVNGKNATPGEYAGVAYAGGAALLNLIQVESPSSWSPGLSGEAAPPATQAAAYGNFYQVINNVALTSALPTLYTGVYANCCGLGAGGGGAVEIRPSDITADSYGTIWYLDNHFPELNRIDANNQVVTDLIGWGGGTAPPSGMRTGKDWSSLFASLTYPEFCTYGTTSAGSTAFQQGPETVDAFDDGCPALISRFSGQGIIVVDGPGNIYNADTSNAVVRKFSVNTSFPPTPLANPILSITYSASTVTNKTESGNTVTVTTQNPTGFTVGQYANIFGVTPAVFDGSYPVTSSTTSGTTYTFTYLLNVSQTAPGVTTATTNGFVGPVTQAIQVHFDSTNNPVQAGSSPNITTSSFSIPAGIPDFTINSRDPSYTLGGIALASAFATPGSTSLGVTGGTLTLTAGPPSCAQLGAAQTPDLSLDCLVYVTFNPTAPGLRQAQLLATTANGSKFAFGLTGIGIAGQLAIDGGQQTVVPATGLGATSAVAVTSSGTVYIADATNNRVVVEPAGGGVQTTIGTGLKGPMGVAVDSAGSVYISDTGNNRILKVNPFTGAQTVLGGIEAVSTPAYPAYAFKAPQGLAVDATGNVYVADTGNAAIVEIPSNLNLGGAVALLQYPGAPTFVSPVGVAVDAKGNIFVADTGNPFQQVVEIPPGGGDLQTILPSGTPLPLFGGQGITTPSGVAVDAADNVYISDGGSNTVIEAPASSTFPAFAIGFTGLSAPAGLAIDPNGNLYVADSGNNRILFNNRQNPIVGFGNVPQGLSAPSGVAGTPAGCPVVGSSTPCTGVLTVTNTGNLPVPLSAPLVTVTSTPNTAFVVTTTCSGSLAPGATCTVSPTFQPTSDSAAAENVAVNGTNNIAMVGNSAQPLANVVLTLAYSGGSPVSGGTATANVVVTQPHIPGNTPTGTVTFTYTTDAGIAAYAACATSGSVTVPLSGSGGTATASYVLPALLPGRSYVVTALYNGDANNVAGTGSSPTGAPPVSFYVQGVPVTATAPSIAYTYGQAVPKVSGTVTGIVDAGVVATFSSLPASSSSPVGSYPITVSFSGGTGTVACNYGSPQVNNPGTTTLAVAVESAEPLVLSLPPITAVYGAANLNLGPQLTLTGVVNGDANRLLPAFQAKSGSVTYGPPLHTSILPVAGSPYTLIPSETGKPIAAKDYTATVSVTSGALTIVQAPSAISTSFSIASPVAELPANSNKATIQVAVGTGVGGGIGVPTGTVTVYDAFTPIIPTAPGVGTPVPCSPTAPSACATTPVVLTLAPSTGLAAITALTSSATTINVTTANAAGLAVGQTATIVGATPAALNGTYPIIAATTAAPYTLTLSGGPGSFTGTVGPSTPITTLSSSGTTITVTTSAASGLLAGQYVTVAGATPVAFNNIYQITAATTVAPFTVTLTGALGTLSGTGGNLQTFGSIETPSGIATFTPPANGALGVHQYSFAYNGDSNFLPSVLVPNPTAVACTPANFSSITNCELIDNPDFVLVNNTGELIINPGTLPSAANLLAPTTFSQNVPITVTGLLAEGGVISLSCLPIGNPPALAALNTQPVIQPPSNAGTPQSYIQCLLLPPSVTLSTSGTAATQTSILWIYTPATEPLGYKYFSSQLRLMNGSETVLAFIPLGMLAFCMRRRRRLTKALWVLLAIAVVTAGMSGCGGNQVAFYSPIPQGFQYVQVTATGLTTGTSTTVARSFNIPVFIQ